MPITGKTGNNWTGEYSRWTFDETKAYLMVAKMMLEPGSKNGIPLLDAELNEQTEINLQMLRRAIKRIYGNGSSNDGFKIIQSASNPNNNFTISGGDGTPAGAGSIFVEGWQPINLSNIEYTAQSYSPAALTTPASNRADIVYIDVYYTEINRTQDGSIIDPTINLETSRRIALVWEVKVAEGVSMPASYTDANNIQHWTFKLATLNRLAGNPQITTAMIVDERNAGRLISLGSELSAHAGLSNPHNATSAATADRIILRDAVGRAKVAAPSALDDIARKAEVDAVIPSGTSMLFVQSTAPTGWTKSTTHNDKALRVVSGTAGSGGSLNFSAAFAASRTTGNAGSHSHNVWTGGATLSIGQLAAHYHDDLWYGNIFQDEMYGGQNGTGPANGNAPYNRTTGWTGGGEAHTHGAASDTQGQHGHAMSMEVKYVDSIIAVRN